MNKLGVVIIGRNEGLRLEKCIKSVINHVSNIVYVDSGSTDDSISIAKSYNVEVVNLDLSTPFTAARARNTGFKHLQKIAHNLNYIQFIDGDCEMVATWFEMATTFLEENLGVGVVCGKLIEKKPDKSVYNLLCSLEWESADGPADSCGGVFLIRKQLYIDVNGMNTEIIAGEEPEMCLRIRSIGWSIYKLNIKMAYHDANILFFHQWWKRSMRGGLAYAIGFDLHGLTGKKFRIKECLRIWFWTFFLPISIIVGSLTISQFLFLIFFVYIIQLLKIAKITNDRICNWKVSFTYAAFTILEKFPQFIGQIKYISLKIRNKSTTIVEYK